MQLLTVRWEPVNCNHMQKGPASERMSILFSMFAHTR